MRVQVSPETFKQVYTHAPDLQANLLRAGGQLFIWLFFHPTAWRNYTARLEPALPADFSLAELKPAHWRDPALRRLLILALGLYPLVVGLLVSPSLWFLQGLGVEMWQPASVRNSLALMGYIMLYSLTATLTVSLTVSLVSGITYGVLIGLVIGLVDGMTSGPALGLAYGLAASLTSAVAIVTSQPAGFSLPKEIGGFVLGALIAGLIFIPIYGLTSGLLLGLPATPQMQGTSLELSTGLLLSLGLSLVAGLIFSLLIGWRTGRWRHGLKYGLLFGAAAGVVYWLIFVAQVSETSVRLARGVGAGMFFGIFWAIPYTSAKRMAGAQVGAIASALVGGTIWALVPFFFDRDIPPVTLPVTLMVILSGLTLYSWKSLLLYPLLAAYNRLLYNLDRQRSPVEASLLPWHSACWDEFQPLKLWGLEEHLLLVLERNPVEGNYALEYLASGDQRWAAQAAMVELEARNLASRASVMSIAKAHRLLAGELSGPASLILRDFRDHSRNVETALNYTGITHQRLAISRIERDLASFGRDLIRSSDPYANRFLPIARQWHQILQGYERSLAQTIELSQEIDNPYIFGAPLTAQDEIFVVRPNITSRIEQLLLDRRRSPLLLYGQRRMGKTSLLHHPKNLLPNHLGVFHFNWDVGQFAKLPVQATSWQLVLQFI